MSLECYQSFAINHCVSFIEGKGGLPLIKIDHEDASALISIYGAQVLSYQPKQNNELLFVSELAHYDLGKAIKGGIPICWPWFGKDPDDVVRQMHGFARNMLWNLDEVTATSNGNLRIVMSLSDSKQTHKLWSHDFALKLTITIGKTLHLSLQTVNTGASAFEITQALHTYFSVADIDQIQVNGLDKIEYIDTVNELNETKVQEGVVRVNQEVDRIYKNAPARTTLTDEKIGREIVIDSIGSKTTVVWNPWVEISKKSSDLENDAYQRFICIETANAAADTIVVKPNESYVIEAEYSASKIS